MSNLQIVSVLCCAGFLFACVLTDLRERKIRNRTVAFGISTAAILHIASMAVGQVSLAGSSLFAPLVGLLVGGGCLLVLYMIRACGAGDVKLMAMVGAFGGAQFALLAVLLTLVAGGALAIVMVVAKGVARKAIENTKFLLTDWLFRVKFGGGRQLSNIESTALRLPYAVAIALGTFAAFAYRFPP